MHLNFLQCDARSISYFRSWLILPSGHRQELNFFLHFQHFYCSFVGFDNGILINRPSCLPISTLSTPAAALFACKQISNRLPTSQLLSGDCSAHLDTTTPRRRSHTLPLVRALSVLHLNMSGFDARTAPAVQPKKLEKKPIKFSNLLLGAGLNMFEVTTLGQPLEVIKTTMAANRTVSFAGALRRIWQRGGALGCSSLTCSYT